MLTDCIAKLAECRVIRALRAFFGSALYTVLIIALMVLSNVFSLELPVFYCYLFLGTLAVLFDDDLKALIPMVFGAYMSLSYENNPAMNKWDSPAPSALYDPAFRANLIVILGLAAALIIGRFLSLLILRKKKSVPILTLGFAALSLSFLLGGIFTKYYDFKTAFFGFTVSASLCGLYFLFYYTVDFGALRKGYWAETFTAAGFGVALELIGMYVKSGILTDPTLDRGVLLTGWGMYNSVGCVLAMCLPAALYLAASRKHGWVYVILSVLLGVALLFTQSRSSVLFGGIVYLAGMAVVLFKKRGKERRNILIVAGSALALVAIAVIVICCHAPWREKFGTLFSDVFEKMFDGNGRDTIYPMAIEHFKEGPFFGVGFYHCKAFRWGYAAEDEVFLPPRYHNTVLQLLASGGIFAFLCYLLHRVETAFLLFRHPTAEKTCIALSIGALLLTSLLECHFFSFGPGLLYGLLLAFAECSPQN